MEQDSITHVYYIRSEAQVSDVFSEDIPATRVVAAYAIHHVRPLAHHSAVVVAADRINLGGGGTDAHGVDPSTVSDCAGGGASSITGEITLTDVKGGNVQGNPAEEAWGTFQAIYHSIGLQLGRALGQHVLGRLPHDDAARFRGASCGLLPGADREHRLRSA
jgi:hypothetical protein